ncbi:hypothetical protein N7532_011012 [Penicillium argentinense]|uniref:G-patch domain-containing protein n=1 Tax=Penicillium argentinense TaxID=1131581 RepID=A0A9W9EHP2_9EURO|nr:uncharacterized protein N7532_011012 [Penicillium argentinense]KAJ5081969.1 hypothetical protein N7532_011012 [Penicillium argentinense]
MPPDSNPPNGRGMMLYANLLDPDPEPTPGTITRAPVVFQQQGSETDAQTEGPPSKKQHLDASHLRFQPVKRPQLAQKPKAKPTLPKVVPQSAAAEPSDTSAVTSNAATSKYTLADWAATEEEDFGSYVPEKRQRGGRKNRKKNYREERDTQEEEEDWDEIYDPTRPTDYHKYKNSSEKIREVQEWKARLYAHRKKRHLSPPEVSDDSGRNPLQKRVSFVPARGFQKSGPNITLEGHFPPPSSFAPPPNLNDYPPPPPADTPDDASGEDAFARRAGLGSSLKKLPPPLSLGASPAPTPAVSTGEGAYSQELQQSRQQSLAASTPPPSHPASYSFQPASATISRAPVRYELPPPPADIPASEAELEEAFAKEKYSEDETMDDAPQTSRPSKEGYAERLLTKYGWTKGSGLGPNLSGISAPLQIELEKRKKKAKPEGGKFFQPRRAKITGGESKHDEHEGKFGKTSEVIVLDYMLDGLDLETEMSSADGGVRQKIGDECSEKYGPVERVHIPLDVRGSVPVFVKFTSELSALKAVNALDGRGFNNSSIKARFFDAEKFERGIYK